MTFPASSTTPAAIFVPPTSIPIVTVTRSADRDALELLRLIPAIGRLRDDRLEGLEQLESGLHHVLHHFRPRLFHGVEEKSDRTCETLRCETWLERRYGRRLFRSTLFFRWHLRSSLRF